MKKGEVLDVFKKIDEEEKFQKEMVTAEKRKKRCAGQSGKSSKKGGRPKRKTSMDSSQGAQQHQNQQPQNQEPENQEEDEVLTSQGNDEPYVPSASQMRKSLLYTAVPINIVDIEQLLNPSILCQ